MSAKYTPTALPVKLDISRSDTGNQLSSNIQNPFPEASRRESKQDQQREEMNRMFYDIVNVNLRDFLNSYPLGSVSGGSSVVFDEWVRSFHSEYEDSWYAKNRERLVRSFRPIWDAYFEIPVSQHPELIPVKPSKSDSMVASHNTSFPDLLS